MLPPPGKHSTAKPFDNDAFIEYLQNNGSPFGREGAKSEIERLKKAIEDEKRKQVEMKGKMEQLQHPNSGRQQETGKSNS